MWTGWDEGGTRTATAMYDVRDMRVRVQVQGRKLHRRGGATVIGFQRSNRLLALGSGSCAKAQPGLVPGHKSVLARS